MPAPRTPRRLLVLGLLALSLGLPLAAAGAGPAVAATSTAPAASPAPRADYRLQHTLTSSVGTAPALTNIGTRNTFTSLPVDGAARTVLHYPKGGGLQEKPSSAVLTSTVYTIVLLIRPDDVSSPFHRLIDVRSGVGDDGLYEIDGHLYAYPYADSSNAVIKATTFSQVVLTRTADRTLTAYVNGRKVITTKDTNNTYVATSTLRFGKDNTSGGATGEETGGWLARVRIYPVALTAAQVASLDR